MRIETEEHLAKICFGICLTHRRNFGYEELPRELSCRYDECKEGCPLTPKEEED